MLAYYLQWHMRRSLAPMLFDEPDPTARSAQRTSPVAKAEPLTGGTTQGPPANAPSPQMANRSRCHSFHTLLGDLATLTRNVVRLGRDHLTAPSSPPPPAPSAAPSICSASRPPRRQTDTTAAN